jgi:hypothetical protein
VTIFNINPRAAGPTRNNYLGNFGTPEEAAQAFLQHWQTIHPEELKKELEKERTPPPVLLPVQEHLLMRSDKGSTGFKGVHQDRGRYQATCNTALCHNHYVGKFDTPEEAAQAYLQHWETNHPEELEKERAPPLQVLLPVQQCHHLVIWSTTSNSDCKEREPSHKVQKGRYQAKCHTAHCNYTFLGKFDTQEEAAQAYLQHWETDHPEELEKEQQRGPRAPSPVLLPVEEHLLMRSDKGQAGFKGAQQDRDHSRIDCTTAPCHGDLGGGSDTPEEAATGVPAGKKRKQPQPTQQLVDGNEALKRCKQEFVEEDHATVQQMLSAVKSAVRCKICHSSMRQASTVSGCGHTFCRDCIVEAVRANSCCPECGVFAWHKEIRDARLLNGVMAGLDGFKAKVGGL